MRAWRSPASWPGPSWGPYLVWTPCRLGGGAPLKLGAGAVDVGVRHRSLAAVAGADGGGGVVGGGQLTVGPPLPRCARVQLDLHRLADRPSEVVGAAEPALEPRGGHREGVAPGDRVRLVEVTSDRTAHRGNLIEVGALGAVDHDEQRRAAKLGVVEGEPRRSDHGLDDLGQLCIVEHRHLPVVVLASVVSECRTKKWRGPAAHAPLRRLKLRSS